MKEELGKAGVLCRISTKKIWQDDLDMEDLRLSRRFTEGKESVFYVEVCDYSIG